MQRLSLSVFVLIPLSVCAVDAVDWPRFRGADGNASAPSANVPLTWNETEHMLWRQEIPGHGASCPAVFADRIYLTSFTGYGLDPGDPGNRQDLRLHVLCFDRQDGRLLWDYQAKDIIRSRPAVWGDVVFVGSDDGYLYGIDRRTGALAWSYRTGGAIAAGPLVAEGRLFVGSTDRRLHAFTLGEE